MSELRRRIEEFIIRNQDPIETGEELYCLLWACVQDGSAEGMTGVRRLFESDFDEFPYLVKSPAACTLILWGEAGIRSLMEVSQPRPEDKNMKWCLPLLATVAAGSGLPSLSFMRDTNLAKLIEQRANAPGLAEFCREHLARILLSIESEEDVTQLVQAGFSHLQLSHVPAAKELFAALSARWLAVSTPVLERYVALIASRADDEPAFQRFFSDHPQLLDPMAVEVWAQPNLFGSRFPDFVFRRADGTYCVVEIECPSKPLVTAGGHLSADTTHAEQQATDYRYYLMQHVADARLHFPAFDEPDCLVINGLEAGLNAQQKRVLREANRTRHRVHIAGFDWLLERARTVARNVTGQRVRVQTIRMV